MTLNEGKELLSKNGISFETYEFDNEATYWHHTTQFPYTKNAKDCKVIILSILSKNGNKNIELQFNEVGNNFLFEELRFGSYCFEMFDSNEDTFVDDLLNHILKIKSGYFAVIIVNDLKNKKWLGDTCFDLNNDDIFGRHDFERAIEQINKPKGLISKLLKTQICYEIYDWNTYHFVTK